MEIADTNGICSIFALQVRGSSYHSISKTGT